METIAIRLVEGGTATIKAAGMRIEGDGVDRVLVFLDAEEKFVFCAPVRHVVSALKVESLVSKD